MKAIYINLDPYLRAVADWLNAGKPGTAPSFQPLPVAVTIPLGESACIYLPSSGDAETDPGDGANEVAVDGQTLYFFNAGTDGGGIPVGAIAYNVAAGLSTLAPSAKYWVEAVTGNISSTAFIGNGDDILLPVPFTVLVRREQAQGPVDLVDFTPPAAAIAAGTDLKGTKFNGNEIVAAAGTGALSAPAGA